MLPSSSNAIVRYMPLRLARWCATRQNLLGVIPIIIFQMGKVGSSSVLAALQEAKLPVFHVHRMDAGHLHKMRERRRALGWTVPPVPRQVGLGLHLKDHVIDRGARAAIVTLVRDPIARNISSYFEHLDAIWHRSNAHEHISLEALIEGFHARFPHAEPLTWFDDAMLPVTGIDVYRHPFGASGRLVVSHSNVELLILKSELPDATKAQALSDFLRMGPLSLTPTNRTSDKAKGAAYEEFMKAVRLAPSYVEQMLESRYARHFYTTTELEALWRKYADAAGPRPN